MLFKSGFAFCHFKKVKTFDIILIDSFKTYDIRSINIWLSECLEERFRMSAQIPQNYINPYQQKIDSSNQVADNAMKFLQQNFSTYAENKPKESWSSQHPFISTGLGAALGGLAGAYMGQSPTDTIMGIATGGLMGGVGSSNARAKWDKDKNEHQKSVFELAGKMLGYNKDFIESANKNYEWQGNIDQGSMINSDLYNRGLNIPRRIIGYNNDGSPIYGAPVVYNQDSVNDFQKRLTAWDMQKLMQQNYGQAYQQYKSNHDNQYRKYSQPVL